MAARKNARKFGRQVSPYLPPITCPHSVYRLYKGILLLCNTPPLKRTQWVIIADNGRYELPTLRRVARFQVYNIIVHSCTLYICLYCLYYCYAIIVHTLRSRNFRRSSSLSVIPASSILIVNK